MPAETSVAISAGVPIPFGELTRFCEQFLISRGVPTENARIVAEKIVETEACGRSTHGLVQLSFLDRRLGEEIDPDREPQRIGGRGGMILFDGSRTMGPLALSRACDAAVEAAREHATALVSVGGTNWVGALGVYLVPLARAGFVAQAWAQIDNAKKCAPWGGRDGRLGTNPIALAFPGPEGEEPVVADFSTTTLSLGTAVAMKKAGETAGEPRFLDAEGSPSRDPNVLWEDGTLMFAGGDVEGYKAYGISLFNEALTAMARETPVEGDPSAQNITLQVIDPTAFAPADEYRERLGEMLERMCSSRPRPGREVRLPGRRALEALRRAREEGLLLDEAKVEMLRELADQGGLTSVV